MRFSRLTIFSLWGLVFVFSTLVTCTPREKFVDTERVFFSFDKKSSFALKNLPNHLQTIIVNFYAPRCPPCENEVPALKKFYKEYEKNSAVGFFAIGSSLTAVDAAPSETVPREPIEAIVEELKKFTYKFSLPYPQYLATPADLKAWRVTGFPETFVFSRTDGKWLLRRKFVSEVTFENLVEQVQLRR
ncbi:MAG: hypothetical protein LDLANPLL_02190 [Turneriella sp.]|nr:hypothetical protein [Turneriella sp.]